MNKTKQDFYAEYIDELKSSFPKEILEEFNPEECISAGEDGETYLFRQKSTNKKCIIKLKSIRQKYRMDIEENVLDRLQKAGFSTGRFLKRLDTETNSFLVREYVEGETLEEYRRQNGRLTENEILKIGMSVCRQLDTLHRMSPALIHRDIKPQNIVITPKGAVRLIDFDSVHSYDKSKERDTYFLGTAPTAAPEQYGFEQTDPRTDIYGIGKTLLWLACGNYDNRDMEKAHYSARFKKVIRKSISLPKKERFKSASAMYKQLNKCRKDVMCRNRRICIGGG